MTIRTMHNLLRGILCSLISIQALTLQASTGIWSSAEHMTSSTIIAIEQDKYGFIWVGTEYGLNRYDGYRYTYYLADALDSCTINDNCVTTLFVDNEGILWVGTRQGLNRYNADTDKFTSITFDSEWQPRIQRLCSDKEGRLWCATSGYGLWMIDQGKATRVHSETPDGENDFYQAMAIDTKGRLWKSDQRGVVSCLNIVDNGTLAEQFRLDAQLGEVVSILPTKDLRVYLVCRSGIMCYDGQDARILADVQGRMTLNTAMLKDNGELIIGTMNHGIWTYSEGNGNGLQPLLCSMQEINMQAANIRALLHDREGNLWAGCYQRGLLLKPSKGLSYNSWNLTESNRPSSSEVTSIVDYNDNELLLTLPGKGLYKTVADKDAIPYAGLSDASFIYQDKRHNYWIATTQGISAFDPQTGRTRLVLPLAGGNVRKITSDKQGRLYISVYSKGMQIYDPSTGKSQTLDMYHALGDDEADRLCNDWIQDMLCDSRGNIWCATTSGICCYDPRSETFCPYGWYNLLSDHLCQCLAEDADGNILVGTNDGAYIYDVRTRQLSPDPIPGLALMSRSVCGIVAMADHSVWMSTSRGIWLFDPDLGELVPSSHVEGHENHEYNQGVASKLEHGDIVFGQHDGFVLFNPETVRQQRHQPSPLVLTAFVMGGDVIKPGELSGNKPIYDCNVTQAHEFNLAYDDNSFVMEFSSMAYDASLRSQLEYAIDGGRWQVVPEQRNVITFNHMPPGEYHLRVRASNRGAYSAESSYIIRITPPWYASWWAQTIYGLLLLAFASICLWMWMRHKRTQLEDEKMQLLIDATHDIRTPLTLILSPLHQLQERYQRETDTSGKLQTIEHNARRILTLVNQILDIRKFDKQQMPFNPQSTDIVRMIENSLHGFYYEAEQRKIRLTFNHEGIASPFNVSLDRGQFEKVIINLVGNSLKYTPDGGEIDIDLTQDGKHMMMKVSDTGIGLPNGETERIFHRFYQADNAKHGEGTGIGLNLCMKVMQLHGGTITASARQDGRQGSVFTTTLPLVKAADDTSTVPVVTQHRQPSRNHHILLVDDDREITNYITNELSNRYHFQACSNGYEALQLLLADPTRYDVLVSDVVMPEMDGMTLLRSIKSNSQIAHIPVVLLTSKTEIDSRVEGLSAGADAYMAKPFVIDELCATIDGLIANTLRHRSKFGGNVEAAKAASMQAADVVKGNQENDMDGKLLERIVKVVNQHLSESEFGVDELCLEVGVSRSQLHRKMKDLTGIGAGEFIRNIRLEQAARMLKETEMNVSQVAYAVGFSNLGHFSKIFRTHFGVYPSDYSQLG